MQFTAQKLSMQTFMERFLTPFVDRNFHWHGVHNTARIYYDRLLIWELTHIEHKVDDGFLLIHFTHRFNKVRSTKKVLYQEVLLQKKMFPRRIQRINLP